jgi:hypothetical protein
MNYFRITLTGGFDLRSLLSLEPTLWGDTHSSETIGGFGIYAIYTTVRRTVFDIYTTVKFERFCLPIYLSYSQ